MQLKTTSIILIALTSILIFSSAWTTNKLSVESAPVGRGATYAGVRACTQCHGDPDNPAADRNYMDCSNVNTMPWHQDYSANCTDVMAYFDSIRLRRTFNNRAQFNSNNPLIAGERLARKYHCFQCHGHLGQGGFANAGSLKGYVPGYFGKDFAALTRNADPESVRAWITHGVDAMIFENPLTGGIAKFFFENQAVGMPSFKSLPTEEIEILVDYVIALHQLGPMSSATVRSYGEQSQSPRILIDLNTSTE